MLILGFLGMYFDAAVVFVTKSSLLYKLAMAILWLAIPNSDGPVTIVVLVVLRALGLR